MPQCKKNLIKFYFLSYEILLYSFWTYFYTLHKVINQYVPVTAAIQSHSLWPHCFRILISATGFKVSNLRWLLSQCLFLEPFLDIEYKCRYVSSSAQTMLENHWSLLIKIVFVDINSCSFIFLPILMQPLQQ